jgi:hypothetical protein
MTFQSPVAPSTTKAMMPGTTKKTSRRQNYVAVAGLGLDAYHSRAVALGLDLD